MQKCRHTTTEYGEYMYSTGFFFFKDVNQVFLSLGILFSKTRKMYIHTCNYFVHTIHTYIYVCMYWTVWEKLILFPFFASVSLVYLF